MSQHAPILITSVRVRLSERGRLLAFVSITLNGSFAVKGVKIINGPKGPFIAFPARLGPEQRIDVCHTINSPGRHYFTTVILDAYERARGSESTEEWIAIDDPIGPWLIAGGDGNGSWPGASDDRFEASTAADESPLRITAIRVKPCESGRLLAFASITLNGWFAVKGIKIIEGPDRRFIAFPTREGSNNRPDVCHPINSAGRQVFTDVVLDAYEKALASGSSEEWIPVDDLLDLSVPWTVDRSNPSKHEDEDEEGPTAYPPAHPA